MPQDFSVTLPALSAQRAELESSARELGDEMDAAHGAETGVNAPLGRTSLRELLEGAIGETRAIVRLGEDDITHVVDRLFVLETKVEELDLTLGDGWEDLPL